MCVPAGGLEAPCSRRLEVPQMGHRRRVVRRTHPEVMTWRGGRDLSFQTFLALTWERGWRRPCTRQLSSLCSPTSALQALTSTVPAPATRVSARGPGLPMGGQQDFPGLSWESHWCPVSGRAAVSQATLCPKEAFSYVFGLRMER